MLGDGAKGKNIKNTIKIGFSAVKFSRSLLYIYIYQQLFLDNMLHFWALGTQYGWIVFMPGGRARCLSLEHCQIVSPYMSSILQILFYFWFFEIREGILRNQKFICVDSFSIQRFIYLALFG